MTTDSPLKAIVLAALLVAVGSCGTSGDETAPTSVASDDSTTTVADSTTTVADSTTTVAETTTTVVETTTTVAETTTTVADTTTTTVAETTTTAATTTTTLPGDQWEFAIAGTVAGVAGVAFDGVFPLRVLPGDGQPVAASLPPLTELTLTGNGRELDQGSFSVVWVEVTGGGGIGWISQWSLVYPSDYRDVTAEAVSEIGMVPTAPTMLELGEIVTGTIVPSHPDDPPPRIVLAAEPTAGPTSEAVYDTFLTEAFGDDTTLGSRYRITGQDLGGALGYELVSVEASRLCSRGLDMPTGFCV